MGKKLNFSDDVPKSHDIDRPVPPTSSGEKTTDENAMSDGEDLALSQMLDHFEQSQTSIIEPPSKVSKIDKQQNPSNRLALNLSRFAFVSLKRPNKENSFPANSNPNQTVADDRQPDVNETGQEVNKPVRNRFLCTPSDDETSQSNKSTVKKSFSLNFFRKPLLTCQKSTPSNDSQPENDSAYDTMSLSSGSRLSTSSDILGSAAKTGKTPSIFPATGHSQKKEHREEHDLSYLDTLEFGDADF